MELLLLLLRFECELVSDGGCRGVFEDSFEEIVMNDAF